MENLNMQVISNHLAANVSEQGEIVFCENTVMVPTKNSGLNNYFGSDSKFMQSNGDITFMYLDPEYNYLHGPYDFSKDNLNPTFECYADDNNMIVTICWDKGEQTYGLLGSLPQSPEHFPAAGYLALEELKYRITDTKAYKKVEDALFEAIGHLLYPGQQKATKFTRRLYRSDLLRHHKAASFPLKGTAVQSGIRCMINGELHVLTHYGVAKVSYGAYGNLVMDTSFRIDFSEDACSIDMRVFCNSEAPTCYEFQGAATSPSTSSGGFNVYSFPEIFQALSSHYKNQALVKSIFTAVLSEVCFHFTDTSLQTRWLNASEIIETVLEEPLAPVLHDDKFRDSGSASHMPIPTPSGISDHCPMPFLGIKSRLRFTEFADENKSQIKKWVDGV